MTRINKKVGDEITNNIITKYNRDIDLQNRSLYFGKFDQYTYHMNFVGKEYKGFSRNLIVNNHLIPKVPNYPGDLQMKNFIRAVDQVEKHIINKV